MIGSEIIYKVSEEDEKRGKIVDIVPRMKYEDEEGFVSIISGYLVQDSETTRIRPVAYFQVKQIV